MSFGGERTGWRDEALSRRHRGWGFNCPGIDVDFLLVEYHLELPVALVEYKHFAKKPSLLNLDDANHKALRHLADRAPPLPFMVARYWPEDWAFKVLAMNEVAEGWYGTDWRSMSELEYVESLHAMRSVVLQRTVLRHLKTVSVEEAERRRRTAS